MRALIVISMMSIFAVSANEGLDQKLKYFIQRFRLHSPQFIQNTDLKKYYFGKSLFSDEILSVRGGISCQSCHHPRYGTSDALPFSIGVGGIYQGKNSRQQNALLAGRSAPHLFNKGHPSVNKLFWDGRVSFNREHGHYITPEPGLNGKNSALSYISSKIENTLAMQALFPIASIAEMRGSEHAHLTNAQTWKLISQRVKNSPRYQRFVKEIKNFNIADIANALSYFQKIEFQVNNTPFDFYLNGHGNALSEKEKKGALVFLDKGRCVRCHNGPLLSNSAFQAVATAHVEVQSHKFQDDFGRFAVTGQSRDIYTFLTSPLRNIALTAPYMHNGALETLKDVANHYNDIFFSIDQFTMVNFQRTYSGVYSNNFILDKDKNRNYQRKIHTAPVVRLPLGLTEEDKNDLVCFLKKSLTQKRFHSRLDLKECI